AAASTRHARSPRLRVGPLAAGSRRHSLPLDPLSLLAPLLGRGLCGGELAVDDAGDREELPAIDAAGKCIATNIVDPVEAPDAVLASVAKGSLKRGRATCAHKERHTRADGVPLNKTPARR